MPDRHEIPRADLPGGEPAQGRQFSAPAERVIQQERQGVQNAHFRRLFLERWFDIDPAPFFGTQSKAGSGVEFPQ